MASEVHAFTVTLPALTQPVSPVTIDVSFPAMIVESIKWRVPPGHVGLTGWRLMSGPGQVVPANLGAWIIADGESGSWELSDLHDSGFWQVQGYNIGNQPHSIYLRFEASPISKRNEMPLLIPAHQLVSSPDLSKAGPPINRGS